MTQLYEWSGRQCCQTRPLDTLWAPMKLLQSVISKCLAPSAGFRCLAALLVTTRIPTTVVLKKLLGLLIRQINLFLKSDYFGYHLTLNFVLNTMTKKTEE